MPLWLAVVYPGPGVCPAHCRSTSLLHVYADADDYTHDPNVHVMTPNVSGTRHDSSVIEKNDLLLSIYIYGRVISHLVAYISRNQTAHKFILVCILRNELLYIHM